MNSVIEIGQLTRVEGHGSVELLQEGGRVVDVRLSLHESPRLFEALLQGRRFDEVPEIACRICSICSTVHKVVALHAVEKAIGCEVSEQTRLLRELAVNGGQIESHALHIFFLALPDYLGVGGFPGLARVAPDELQRGLQLKRVGNLLQESIGGRAIHPFNLIIGGLGRGPALNDLQRLADALSGALENSLATVKLVAGLESLMPTLPAIPFCAVQGTTPLFGDHLATSAGDRIPAAECSAWLAEEAAPHTHAKFSRFHGAGPFMAGPLARLSLAPPLSPLARSAHHDLAPRLGEVSPAGGILARAVELLDAVERALELVHILMERGVVPEAPVPACPRSGEGASLAEAPRGTLLHSYAFDDRGRCVAADIITPTAINQAAMESSLKSLIKRMDGAGYDEVKAKAEQLVRCFDPCISCAVH